jgi:hypothetical protein
MWLAGEGDGVVSLESARLDSAVSQVVVQADHQHVHRVPQSILEVRRILVEHINELQSFPYGGAGSVEFAASPTTPGVAPPPQLPQPVATLPTQPAPR